jgi:hypothetical protein
MKIKNFRLRNRGLYYFFPGWNTLPFFNRKSRSLKHSLTFPSDHSPNRLIPPSEARSGRRFGLWSFGKGGFLRRFFSFNKETP